MAFPRHVDGRVSRSHICHMCFVVCQPDKIISSQSKVWCSLQTRMKKAVVVRFTLQSPAVVCTLSSKVSRPRCPAWSWILQQWYSNRTGAYEMMNQEHPSICSGYTYQYHDFCYPAPPIPKSGLYGWTHAQSVFVCIQKYDWFAMNMPKYSVCPNITYS